MAHSPPPQPGWRFPPPPISRRWGWLAAIATVLGFGLLATWVVVIATVGPPTSDSTIDSPDSLEAIDTYCSLMISSVEDTDMGDTPEDRVGAIDDQNVAIYQMIDAIGLSVGPDGEAGDPPIGAWLDDWESLADARTEYADKLWNGARMDEVEITIPLDQDGDPITERMSAALPVGDCAVPEILIDPDVNEQASV